MRTEIDMVKKITLYLPDDFAELLKQRAKKNNRSTNAEIKTLLEHYLLGEQKEQPEKGAGGAAG